jgi:quinol-cytochrome oxidoreductase complex cytochrome b subunit
MILLSALATIAPAEMGPPADPLSTPEVIKPEWFFYVAFRWLKLFSGSAAVLSMGAVVALMFGWPFIDAFIRRRSRFQEASVWIGILGVLAILGLTVWEALVAH